MKYQNHEVICIVILSAVVLCNCDSTPSGEQVERAFIDNDIVKDCNANAPEKFLTVCKANFILLPIEHSKFSILITFFLNSFGNLKVTYVNGVSVDLGNELTPAEVKFAPNPSWEAEDGELYSLIFIDLHIPSHENLVLREYRHWLNVNCPGSSIDQGDNVLEYQSSTPPEGSDPHRYIFFIFKQPNRIPPDQLNQLRVRYTILLIRFTLKSNENFLMCFSFGLQQFSHSS